MNIELRVRELGFTLPAAPKPAGAYTPVVIAGGLAFVSGQISKTETGTILTGKAGSEIDLAAARQAAQAAALNVLSIVHHWVGGEKIARVVRLGGFVQVSPDFFEIPKVVDAASELFQQVFGEKGSHARASVGVASLPLNAAVEIDAVFELLRP